jgi:hypothetical protein
MAIPTQPGREAYARRAIPAIAELDDKTVSAEIAVLKGEIAASGKSRAMARECA